jgi:excisionase family DNA binding protein
MDSRGRLLDRERGGRALKISRWKVYELIRSRELDSFRLGRCRRIPASAVGEMVARLSNEAA